MQVSEAVSCPFRVVLALQRHEIFEQDLPTQGAGAIGIFFSRALLLSSVKLPERG